MKKVKTTCCVFCSNKFTTEKMNQVHCGIKCRIFAHIEKIDNGCWIWKGSTDRDGYGLMSIDDRSRRVHRISYEVFKEEKIPFDKNACHSCDTPACVNPDHIFVAKSFENTQDMMEKGRSRFSGRGVILNAEKIKKIRFLASHSFSSADIGRMFKIGAPHVDQIVERKIWDHIP